MAGETLRGRGHFITEDSDSADAHVLLTCTVIDSTERRMVSRMRSLTRTRKPLVVSGCMATAQLDIVKNSAPAALIVSPGDFEGIANALCTGSTKSVSAVPPLGPEDENVDATVPIANGCLGHCTYCITRLARGALKSQDTATVLSRIRAYLDAGYKEIRLAAQDAGAYGKDIGRTLPEIVDEVANLPGDFRVRVGMANPSTCLHILDDLVEAYSSPKVYKFLHLPVQSGDDDILESMGRDYSVTDFRHIVEAFRRKHKKLTLSTDIIVGFPGETEDQFRASVQLVEDIRPDIVNVTRFSPRPGTPAVSMKNQVVGWLAKERSKALMKVRFRIAREINASYEGRTLEAMTVERGKGGTTLARTPDYKQIVIKETRALGQDVIVKVIKGREIDFFGEIVESKLAFEPRIM